MTEPQARPGWRPSRTNLVAGAIVIAGFLGFLVILADDRRQAWHDKIARTCVVYSWGAVPHAAHDAPGPDAGARRP